MPRYRIAFSTVSGDSWFVLDDYISAVAAAQRRLEAGVISVEVLEERAWDDGEPHGDPVNYVRVWPVA